MAAPLAFQRSPKLGMFGRNTTEPGERACDRVSPVKLMELLSSRSVIPPVIVLPLGMVAVLMNKPLREPLASRWHMAAPAAGMTACGAKPAWRPFSERMCRETGGWAGPSAPLPAARLGYFCAQIAGPV